MTGTPSAAAWSELFTLLEQLDATAYEDVAIELDGLSLRMSKQLLPSAGPVTSPDRGHEPGAQAPAVSASQPTAPAADSADLLPTTNLVSVTAPMLGVIYRRPAPDQDPFVQVGDEVQEDTTVAIVEVMKLMNPVTAGTSGRVAAIQVEDGDLVEFGQVLIQIAPVGSP